MSTDELSICGYCCTGKPLSARRPTSTMTRLTTSANTGCLMNTSVKERMAVLLSVLLRRGGGSGLGRLHFDAFTQLEGAGGGELLARLQPFQHDHRLPEG